MRPEKLNFLFSSIGILKGVGPKLEKIINKLGINLNIHFLWHIPHNVIERKYYENIKDADLNTIVTLKINNKSSIHHFKLNQKRKIDHKIISQLKNAGVSLKIN